MAYTAWPLEMTSAAEFLPERLDARAVVRVIDSRACRVLELSAKMGRLSDKAGTLKPEAISAGGKISVCAAPVYRNETPCATLDVTARFKMYLQNWTGSSIHACSLPEMRFRVPALQLKP